MSGVPRRTIVLVAVALAVWTGLAVSLAASNAPWSNEAWCAIPAVNLATHGYMGTTVLVSKGSWLVGIERHTYWIMPLHPLVQAAWYKLVGFSLFRQRLLSVLFGALALLAWFVIVLRLSGRYYAAFIACLAAGFERNFLNAAANGRMDMMAAALGASAIASFLQLRRRSIRAALVVSHSLAAASIFTHPCGVLFAAALVVTMLYSERPRLRLADAAIACTPYLVGAGLWGLYIAQAPADFKSQFFGNVSGFAGEYLQRERFSGITAPCRALWLELKLRYLLPFGFGALNTISGAGSAVWLSLCACAAFAAVLNRKLRSQSGVRILAACGLTVFLLMALFEGIKFQHYLVYSLPFLAALAAMAGGELWQRGHMRLALCAVLTIAIGFQTSRVLQHFIRNSLRSEFLPAARWVQARLEPEDRVIAPAELGYVLGFDGSIADDVRLGFYTGLRPRFIVTSEWYRHWAGNSAQREPAAYNHIRNTLSGEYRCVLAKGEYIVYEKRDEIATGR
ncbi:MAG: glycosyltransferase family 39 protein [Bryobacteraceae bacterium]|jgi:4-amino-4-deoxy-L-arabinose transferase-like glycosyltransferase